MISKNLFDSQEVSTRQQKIKYLFDREMENNLSKLHVLNQSENSKDIIVSKRFWYPRILIEEYRNNDFVKYDIYTTNTSLYFPVSEPHIDLCIVHGIETYSRTLRIFQKKKALKRLLKSRNRAENWKEIVSELSNNIEKIYNNGKTINLNLIK